MSSSTGRQKMTYNVFTAMTAPATSGDIFVKQFQYAVIRVTATGATTATIKVAWISDADINPDFSIASSTTNPWFPISVVNQDTLAPISWSTGISITAAGTTSYTMNADALEYIGLQVTALTGQLDVSITMTENT